MTELLSTESDSEILKKLNLEEEKFDHYLQLFTQWISSQTHLQQNFNETCKKKFLLWAKLDFEKAKKKFQKYCYTPVTFKEFIQNRTITIEGDLKALNFIHMLPLPNLTPEGYRIWLYSVYDADNFDSFAMVRMVTIAANYVIHKQGLVAGESGIFDMAQLKPHHYAKMFTPAFLTGVKYNLLTVPFLIKNIYVVNCHPLLEKGIALVKAILPKKLADRITILTKDQDVTKFLPAECLPKIYGGNLNSVESLQDQWMQCLMKEKDFLEEFGETVPLGPIPDEFQTSENEFGVEAYTPGTQSFKTSTSTRSTNRFIIWNYAYYC
ncbi:CRAL/TRIO domain [Popillia japonica]|uniref:CRAL/TRIO domain n=1 Tax=Popillia japonica TaxID=7064 RepID=A0AAW1MG52_POPJA